MGSRGSQTDPGAPIPLNRDVSCEAGSHTVLMGAPSPEFPGVWAVSHGCFWKRRPEERTWVRAAPSGETREPSEIIALSEHSSSDARLSVAVPCTPLKATRRV